MEVQITPYLWVEKADDEFSASNVLSGRKCLLNHEQLEHLFEFCEPKTWPEGRPELAPLRNADLILSLEETNSVLEARQQVVRGALEKFLADQLGTTKSKVRRQWGEELVEKSLVTALEASDRKDEEAHRDLKSLFRNAATFLGLVAATDRLQSNLLRATSGRPKALDQFGQLPCLPLSTQRRTDLGLKNPVKKMLVLGDDDLVTPALLAQSEAPCHTFELDQRLLELLRSNSAPNLTVLERDLTQGLPSEYHAQYDLVYTDPPYNRAGMDLFLLCCAQGLTKSGSPRLLLTTRPDLIEDGDKLPDRLRELGLQIEEHLVDFSCYRWLPEMAQNAFSELKSCRLSSHLLRALLSIPLYHADMFVVSWEK